MSESGVGLVEPSSPPDLNAAFSRLTSALEDLLGEDHRPVPFTAVGLVGCLVGWVEMGEEPPEDLVEAVEALDDVVRALIARHTKEDTDD